MEHRSVGNFEFIEDKTNAINNIQVLSSNFLASVTQFEIVDIF